MTAPGETAGLALTVGDRRTPHETAATLARLIAAVLALLPFSGWFLADSPVSGRLVVAGLFGLALARPADALAVLAGLLVLGTTLGAILHTSMGLDEPLLLAFLGGWLVHDAWRGRAMAPATRAVVTPALVLALIIASSALVQAVAARAMDGRFWTYVPQGLLDWARYFVDGAAMPGSTAPMLGGIALFVAVISIARDRASGERVVRMALAGAAGLAALNVVRFASIALRTGLPLTGALEQMRELRISVLGEYNATGSYLVLMLFAAVGLAAAARRVPRASWPRLGTVGWLLLAGLLLAAIWLTRSRAALLAVPLGLLTFQVLIAGARRRAAWWKAVTASAVALAIVVVLVARFVPPDAGLRPAANMIEGRVEMARVSLELFRTDPVFGIGVGRFLPLSAEHIAPRFRPTTPRENAHNNFLQILAELGIIGLAAFCWTLARVALSAGSVLRPGAHPVAAGVATGLVAFVFTWLTGHPLLARHACHAFWLMLGLMAALAGAEGSSVAAATPVGRGGLREGARSGRLAIAALVAVLLVSVPLRANRLVRQEADLEHVSFGLSPWMSGADGSRYRTVAGAARFFVRREVCRLVMPVRADGEGPVGLQVRLDGRVANSVQATGGWSPISMVIPETESDVRFHEIELRTSPRNAAVRVADSQTVRCR